MLDVIILDEAVIERGSLAADLIGINHQIQAVTHDDLKRLAKQMEALSPRSIKHFISRETSFAI